MSPMLRHCSLLSAMLVSLSVGPSWAGDTAAKMASGMSLSLEEIYASPSLIGTRPGGISWSPDSRRFAFLWNDQGHAFRDIWVYSVAERSSQRMTFLAQDPGSANSSGVTSVAWSGDEQGDLIYVLDDVIYRLEAEGAGRILARGDGIAQISVSPDGRKLAFASRSGLSIVPLHAEDQAEARQLISLQEKQQISEYQWITGANEIVFSVTDYGPLPERDIHYYTAEGLQTYRVSRAFPGDETAHYHLGVVALDSGQTRYFERPDMQDYIWNWGVSNDGSRLFVNSSDLLVKHHRIFLYDISSGERTGVYHEYDAHHLRPDWRAEWAPDDEGLVILTDRDGFLHLYQQPDEKVPPRRLTSGEWEISSFWVDRAQQQLYFLGNRSNPGDRLLYRVPAAGGHIESVSTEANGMHAPVFSPDMRYAASIYSNDLKPHDLFLLDLHNDESVRVTRSPLDIFYAQQWAQVRYIEFPSHTDGTTLVGRLSLPPDFDPNRQYPLIVGSVYSDSVLNQWGGRQSHPTWGLDQYLVAQGYILLNVNIRGSWGQGRKHNQGLRHGYGIVDIEDLHSGVRHLIEAGMADPERIGMWGSSYGGLMTMMSLFKKPGVYAVGIAGAPATNVAHAYPGQMWVMGEPTGEDQPARYQQQSPLYHTNGLEDPLMIIHGTRDQVVLYSDTIAVAEKLIDKQQLFELVTVPGVGHGWDNEAPEVRLFVFKKMVEFFNRHLVCRNREAPGCRSGSAAPRQ